MSGAPRWVRSGLARMIVRDLRQSFRRVVWRGRLEDPAPGRPLVVYANHHLYADSYLLYYTLTHHLGRPIVVWMEAWEQAPLFGPLGALPFPADDPRARVRTIRETARRMTNDPRTALMLYPEGTMGVPEAGLAPFAADLPRLARSLPDGVAWWPVAVGASWWGESRPTALLSAGSAHDAPDGTEAERLQAALDGLRTMRPDDLDTGRAQRLLDGTAGPDERWDLSRLAPLFRRWTFRDP